MFTEEACVHVAVLGVRDHLYHLFRDFHYSFLLFDRSVFGTERIILNHHYRIYDWYGQSSRLVRLHNVKRFVETYWQWMCEYK